MKKSTHSVYLGIILILTGIIFMLLGEKDTWGIIASILGTILIISGFCMIFGAIAVFVMNSVFENKKSKRK
ncbi:MAG: hypothetical protein LBM93_10565 [Oscillospiraceae bacterium]|jgi:uncharacterized membrane protein HdeD (DUF308 family)|nr:hypothetical protein [Oscillospiraceae bacterium]